MFAFGRETGVACGGENYPYERKSTGAEGGDMLSVFH